MFLARKITRAKWMRTDELSEGEIPSDAVTADLRTTDNALSFWRCDAPDRAQIEGAALAMAAAGNRIDRMDVVWIADEDLQADGQTWKQTEGRTPVSALRPRHLDVLRLDYVRLGSVAQQISVALHSDRYLRLTRRQVTNLLVGAVKRGDVDLADLAGNLQTEVSRSLEMGSR